jgi:two-component system, NarL family, response regulator
MQAIIDENPRIRKIHSFGAEGSKGRKRIISVVLILRLTGRKGGNTIKLLIADGHSIMREGLRLAAEAEEDMHVVAVADHSMGAVSAFEQFAPDATIFDLQLPNVLQAIATIRKSSPGTTIVVLTMYADDPRVTSALTLGATCQMLRTASGPNILNAVRDVVMARKSPGP